MFVTSTMACQLNQIPTINNKNPKILTKRPPVATTVPSGTQRHHWGIGIPGYTFGSAIQARAIPPPFWGSALPVTTGSLQSLQPKGVVTFNSTEKALTFTIYDCILRIRPKRCYLTKVSPLNVELIQHASSVECDVPVYRLTASKGLTFIKKKLK